MDRGQSIRELTVSRSSTGAEPDRAASQAPFVSLGPLILMCGRGHNMYAAGIYFQVTSSHGKKYTYRRCARCRIEDVQRCVKRKKRRKAS